MSRRLTLADLEAEIAGELYFTGGEGVAGAVAAMSGSSEAMVLVDQDVASLDQLTFCLLVLRNGAKFVGINHGPVDPAAFDAVVGRRYARENAIEKLWEPLGFRLRDELHAESCTGIRLVQTCALDEQHSPALTLADADADVAGVPRPDNPGLNTNAGLGSNQAKPSADMAQQVRDREVSGRALGAALGAGAAQLNIGRLVHYVLSLDDAAKINGRRTNGAAIQDRILEDKWSIGAQAHIGNTVSAGDVLPAMVVRVLPCQQANLQVFLDGNDVFWATTRAEAAPGRTEPGRWHWPARV